MVMLNLPPFEPNIKKAEGKLWIFDVIRKKYVALIPEEWVRQHFVHYLLTHNKYPKALITVETGLQYNRLQKRSDIVVHDRSGKPWMLIECKAPDVPVDEKTVFQVSVYNATLRAKYVVVTNGMRHMIALIDWDSGTTSWLKDVPQFGI
jgi:hypothetical protein